jgi:hypothetical protein
MSSANSNLASSGEGSRPTTAAGVDNIGAADAFHPSGAPEGESVTPNPHEKMQEKRQGPGSDNMADSSPGKATDNAQ